MNELLHAMKITENHGSDGCKHLHRYIHNSAMALEVIIYQPSEETSEFFQSDKPRLLRVATHAAF